LDPCCNICPSDQIKTYSVDQIFHQCGESCIYEKDFWMYKIFEWGLKKADSRDQRICEELNYHYDKTESHGIPGVITIILDMYKPNTANQNIL